MYLIYDVTAKGKPMSYKVPFSDTTNWPRMIHMSWITLDAEFKPIEDYDAVIEPDGFKVTETQWKKAALDEDDRKSKAVSLEDTLKAFNTSLEKVQYVFCHNEGFNENVVNCEYLRTGIPSKIRSLERFDLMKESAYFVKIPNRWGGYKWPSLTQLHNFLFQKSYGPVNNARADVIAATRCFKALMITGQFQDLFDED